MTKAQGALFLIGVASGVAALIGLLAGCALQSTIDGDTLSDSGALVPDGHAAGFDTPAGDAIDGESASDMLGVDGEAGASSVMVASDANLVLTNEATAAEAAGGTGGDANSALDVSSGPISDSGVGQDSGSPGIDLGAPADVSLWLAPMNQARAKVNEAPLVWDPIAAQVALNYAKQCSYMHNLNASAEYKALGGKTRLGENIAAGAPIESIATANRSWIGEAADYDHATNKCAAGKQCGHYTQIVWSTTTGVGCAHVSCTTNSPFGMFASGKWQFEVCDYSPEGNIIGKSPY